MVQKKKTPASAKPTAGKPAAKKNVAAAVKKAALKARAATQKAKPKAEPRPKVEKAARASASANAPAYQAPVDSRSRPTGLHDLAPAAGATHSRKRVGRGPGSGHGKTAGRGNKGQKSRTGYR